MQERYFEKLEFYGNLTEDEKKFLSGNTGERHYKKHEVISSSCLQCLGLIIVKSGSLRVSLISDSGREVTLFKLMESDVCIMSASCVISELTFDVNIMAMEDTDIIVLNSKALSELSERNIYVRCYTYELISKKFSSIMWVMHEILFSSLDRRIAEYLISCSDKTGSNIINVTQEEIATDTGSSREVVTRMLKRFSEDNIIEAGRGKIKIINKNELKKISG